MRRLGLFLAAAALALLFAGFAQAGTLSRDTYKLHYDADPGEANRVFVSTDSEGVHVIDTGATVTAGPGCTTLAPNAVAPTSSSPAPGGTMPRAVRGRT